VDLALVARLTLAVVLANGAPIVARRVLGTHLGTPMDLGIRLAGGTRLLGESKTWRGVAAAVLAGALTAPWLLAGTPAASPAWGAALGAAAMIGDAATSFFKRRLGLAPGRALPVVDQLLEAVLPVLAVTIPLKLPPAEATLVVVAFILLDLGLSPMLRRLGIRRRAL
jgi:CDP-2,3-bis-(O-geranylgeranyl)-sn-glycerol synthase